MASLQFRNKQKNCLVVVRLLAWLNGWLFRCVVSDWVARRWKVGMELGQIDQGTVNIQRRNINSKDHKKKKFDLDFYINLW